MSESAKSASQPDAQARHLLYETLLDEHKERNRFNKRGKPRPEQYFKNVRSTLNGWVSYHGLTQVSPLGEEFGVLFKSSLQKYEEKLREDGYDTQYVKDIKSRLRSCYRTYCELLDAPDLPPTFHEAFLRLCELHGASIRQIARAVDISESTLRLLWSKGKPPNIDNLFKIHLIEDFFSLRRNTLAMKLPVNLLGIKKKRRAVGNTAYRANSSALIRLGYKEGVRVGLLNLPEQLDEELEEFYKFHTDSTWLHLNNLKRSAGRGDNGSTRRWNKRSAQQGGKWTVREDGYCGTARKFERDVRSFMGSLVLPANHESTELRGLGYEPSALSLGLFSVIEAITHYVQFRIARTVDNKVSTTVENFLKFAARMLKPETGFLRQQPKYGERLPVKVRAEEWDEHCEKTRAKIYELLDQYYEDGAVVKTRDNMEIVKPIVLNNQYPLDVVDDMLEAMKAAMLFITDPVKLAVAYRDYLLIKLVSCIPLRVYNVSLLTFGEDPTSCFRRLDDGSLWLFIDKKHFKNRGRREIKDFYVEIEDEELIEAVETYHKLHRKYLLGGKCELCYPTNLDDDKGKCPVAEKTGRKCEYTDFVFAPMALAENQHNKLKPWNTHTISERVLGLTQLFMPQYKGFSIHCFRHIVASDYIKNNPAGYGTAAMLLHITEAMVRKHYAWVEPMDGVRVFNKYRRERREERQRAANRKKATRAA